MRSKSRNERTTDNTSNKEIVFSSNRLEIILLFHVCTRFRLLNALSQFISHKIDGTFLNEIIIIIPILCTHRPMRPFLNEKVLVIPWRSQTVPIEILERNIISHSCTVNLGILDPSRSGTFVLYVGSCYLLTRYFIEIMLNIEWSVKRPLLRLRTLRVMSSHIAIIFHLCPDS